MTQDPSFEDLIRRARLGDDQAATELVRTYEPSIRRAIRMQLTDPRLCCFLDSMDICQSILATFFVRMAAGQFDLRNPKQLIRLLKTMAQNKLCDHVRRLQAQRRGGGNIQTVQGIPDTTPNQGASPSRVVMGKDLLAEINLRLTTEERYLADQRAQGRSWDDIAREQGSTPKVLIRLLTNALDRVVRELHLEEDFRG